MTSSNRMNRCGITLVEVIFAIGVALIGLVGLISVLPVAGRRAQSAINLNEGSALANGIFDELKARGMLKRSAWRVRADYNTSLRNPNSTVEFGAKTATINPNRTTPDEIDSSLSFCIDPLFFSTSHSSLAEGASGSYVSYAVNSGNAYRRMLFPYFGAEHNPLVDPSAVPSTSTNWFAPSDRGTRNAGGGIFDFGARMVRIGLSGPISGAQTARESEAVVDDRNGVALNRTKDRSLNPTIQSQQALSGGLINGKQLTDGGLSWIATCNQLPGTNFMSVSIVIMHQRDRGFFTPLSGSGVASSPRGNTIEERLAYVSSFSGFNGGAGGSVTLLGAANTSDQLQSNDWIMLSRRTPLGDIHRWFRVVSVSKDAQRTTVTDSVHNTQRSVWQHRVFLDGPDWSFSFGDGDVENDTYATLVSGVVAVSEHVILIEP